MYPQLKVLSIWGVGGMQVYEICSHRLMYNEAIVARSNYEKSYLWWFRKIACGDSNGSSQIEKDRVGAPPGLI